MTKRKHNIYRKDADGVERVHVLSEMCSTCIFNPKTRPVSGNRVAGMVRDTMDTDGATVVCHSTLYQPSGQKKANAICRGWFDRLGMRDPVTRMAKAFGIIKEVNPPFKG